MFLKTASLPTNEAATVQAFADANDLSLSYKDFKGYKCPVLQFPIETMCDLLEVAPELRRQPWLFNASDDVIQCEAHWQTYAEADPTIQLGWNLNDQEIGQLEVEITIDQMAELLEICNFIQRNRHGKLFVEREERIYGGAIETTEIPTSVWEWVENNKYDDELIAQLFPAYLCRFGGEWLAKINVEYLENTLAR